jgi:hypothetical protein
MRITGRSALLFAPLALFAATSTPFSTLADLATSLSAGNAPDAIAIFDSGMKQYGELEQNVEAITEQDDIDCAIDVIDDAEQPDGSHKLDVDWFMQITSQLDQQLVRRRERVHLEMRQIKGKWKITSMSPIAILEPLHPKP